MMFKKILQKLQVKPPSARHQDLHSTNPIPYLDLDGEDREDDGFLLIGESFTERSTCSSVEQSLDLPPSYDDSTLIKPPLYSEVFPSNMGARNSKPELFEPTLHAASRQTSQQTPPANTQNDILTPYFEALQNEQQQNGTETAVLCATAAPPQQESNVQPQPSAAATAHSMQQVATAYEDIPFRLTAGLSKDALPTDVSAISEQIKQNERSLLHRYTYDFKLERGVVRESEN